MMKFNNLCKLLAVMAVATTLELFSLAKPAAATEVNFIALTTNNSLVRYDSNSRKFKKAIEVKGIDGNLEGIDFRPANGLLYGVTDTDNVYTIDPDTGAATFVSKLSVSFDGGFQSGFDFNPVIDRLRLTGSNDQSFAVNVDTGAVAVGGNLNYPSGVDPNITGSAYTNSFAGPPSPSRTTVLYGIDYDLDVLVTQNPMTGTLTQVGALGFNLAPISGFDIFSPADGTNAAYALSGSKLYSIDLNTGAATELENVLKEGRDDGFIGLAVTSANSDDKDDNKSNRN
jgi:hypothetical protein